MQEIKLDQSKDYTLTKIHPDGYHEEKTTGSIYNDGGIIRVNETVMVGRGMSSTWRTSLVTGIEKTGKGCLFETLNSTYLLEEYEGSKSPKK